MAYAIERLKVIIRLRSLKKYRNSNTGCYLVIFENCSFNEIVLLIDLFIY